MERRLNCYAIRQTNNPPCIPFVSRTVYTAVLHNPILRLPLAELIAGYSNFPLLSTREKEKTTSGRDQFSIDPESRFFFTIFLCNRSVFVKCVLRYVKRNKIFLCMFNFFCIKLVNFVIFIFMEEIDTIIIN